MCDSHRHGADAVGLAGVRPFNGRGTVHNPSHRHGTAKSPVHSRASPTLQDPSPTFATPP